MHLTMLWRESTVPELWYTIKNPPPAWKHEVWSIAKQVIIIVVVVVIVMWGQKCTTN